MIVDKCDCGHNIIKQHRDSIVWNHVSGDLIDIACKYCNCVKPSLLSDSDKRDKK